MNSSRKTPPVQNITAPVRSEPLEDVLRVAIRAGRETAAPGESVSYDLTMVNTSAYLAAAGVRLMDLLPEYFRLKKDSVRLNGISTADPAISADGRALTFDVGNLAPGSSTTVRFEAEILYDCPQERMVSVATAFAGGKTSNIATVAVKVGQDDSKTTVLMTPKVPVTASSAAASTVAPVTTAPGDASAPVARASSAAQRVVPEPVNLPQQSYLTGTPALPEAGRRQLSVSSKSDLLQVDMTAGPRLVAPGEPVNYDLMITNTSGSVAADVRLMDLIPSGFRFNKGSGRLDGKAVSDPIISADGRALNFSIGTLAPGASAMLSFNAEIPVGSSGDTSAVNVATAFSAGSKASNIAKVTVTVGYDQNRTIATPHMTPVVVSVPASPAVAPTDFPGSAAPGVDAPAASKEMVAVAQPALPSPVFPPQPEPPKKAVIVESKSSPQVAAPVVTAPAPAPLTETMEAQVVETSSAPRAVPDAVKVETVPAEIPKVPAAQSPEQQNGIIDRTMLSDAARRPALAASGAAMLLVTMRAVPDVVASGETVGYDLTIANPSKQLAASDVRLMVLMPPGFPFAKGSVRLGGLSAADPSISADGRALTFVVGDIAPGVSATVRFEAQVPAGSRHGKAVSVASAFSSGYGASDIAKVAVSVGNKQEHATTTVPMASVIPLETTSSLTAGVAKLAGGASDPGNTSATPPAPLKTEPVKQEPVKQEPVKQEPVKQEPVKQEPVKQEPAKQEPAKQEPAKQEPAKQEPAKQEPAKQEPAKQEPAKQEPVKVPVAGADIPHGAATAAEDVSAAPVMSPQAELPKVPDDETAASTVEEADDEEADNPLAELTVPPVLPEAPAREERSPTLAELVGMSDIAVLPDADGQFVKNLAENQVMENEVVGQVDETSLLESIRVGRSFNRESRAARERSEQASAQTGQAFALLLPSVSLRANYGLEVSNPSVIPDPITKEGVADTHSRTDASLTVRQTLFDLPSFLDWQRRKVVEQARGENYRVSDSEAYMSSVNAYLAIVSTRLQAEMTREFEAKLNDLLVYVEKRAKAGAASHSDMARVRARSQATLSSRLEQESAHAAAGVEFIRLTNLVPRKVRLPALEDIGASLLPKTLDIAVATAMKSNPDISALNAEIEAAEFDKKVAKSRYLPKVDAEYTNSYTLHAGGNPSAAGQKDQRLMMVFNWSLFNGGSDYKTHVERTARHKELRYRLDDQRRRVVQTLSASYAAYSTTRERIVSGYQELKSISAASEAMSKRMLSGNQSLLDMLDVYDRLYQVKSRLVNLHILEMSTAAQLVRLMHGTPGAIPEIKAAPQNK